MASAAVELMGFFLGLLGMLGSLLATVLPSWRVSAHVGSNIVTAVSTVKGLWAECVTQSTGTFQCETYNSLLALPAELQAARGLMVASLLLSFAALAAAPLGMQCTLCLGGAPNAKRRAAGTAGTLFVLAGFLTLVPMSWTMHEVVQTFYQPGISPSAKYELGECLYVGMAAALLSSLGGAMLAASCCQEEGGGVAYPAYPMAAVHGPAHAYRIPPLQPGGRGHAHPLSAGSHSSAHGNKKPTAAGYDVTGYV